MREKVILLLFFYFLLAGLVFSQSITVTDPKKDETVAAGAPYTIKWTKTGTMDSKVKIRLYNADSTRNNSFPLAIPTFLSLHDPVISQANWPELLPRGIYPTRE